MIAFLLFLLGIVFHLMALFFSFGCGVEAERIGKGRPSRLDDAPDSEKAINGFYAIIAMGAFAVGLVLIIASSKVS